MRINVEVNDLTPDQWDFLQTVLHTEYGFEPGEPRVWVVFLRHPAGPEERHAEMPPATLARLLLLLAVPVRTHAGFQSSEATLPTRRPRVPTADDRA